MLYGLSNKGDPESFGRHDGAESVRSAFLEREVWLRTTKAWVGACVIGITLLWSSYGFRYGALPRETKPAYDMQQGFEHNHMQNRASARLVLFANRHHWLPEAYLAGLADVIGRSERPAYLFGRFYEEGGSSLEQRGAEPSRNSVVQFVQISRLSRSTWPF